MKYDYICGGNVMLDKVLFLESPRQICGFVGDPDDGSQSGREHIGGPATFAYAGVRIWTDSVMQCSNIGADHETLFKPWIEKNNIETKGFKVVCDRCNHTILRFMDKSGKYGAADYGQTEEESWLKNDAWQDFGYMKTKPEELEVFTKDGVKGVYMAQNADRTFWKKLSAIKKRDQFKMMWEIEAPWSHKHYLEDIREIAADAVDIFSINISEAQKLFEVESDEDCIKGLQTLDVDMTIFRVGDRGLYAVTRDEAIHLPPAPGEIVDPTGCGNTSTGSALYAYAEGKDALMVGIMANIGAKQNIRQYGVVPDFLSVREESYEMAEELYKNYKK
ncbi:MAG: carbohydrate kinase family protein [Oscillospiraceae bacterium]|jgi:sugar/nucleoside kinase (ribokinase family)|nr:carbohydrate kinase family protein [Oscillospiraceae bacterium]